MAMESISSRPGKPLWVLPALRVETMWVVRAHPARLAHLAQMVIPAGPVVTPSAGLAVLAKVRMVASTQASSHQLIMGPLIPAALAATASSQNRRAPLALAEPAEPVVSGQEARAARAARAE